MSSGSGWKIGYAEPIYQIKLKKIKKKKSYYSKIIFVAQLIMLSTE